MQELHPLINSDSQHYNDDKREPAIYEMEQKFTVEEMIAWIRGNLFKYEYRLDKKGQKKSDLKKIDTYKNYLTVLKDIVDRYPYLGYNSVQLAFKTVGLNYRYK